MIGQTISHYRILNQLGEGGMGVVYLAEDTHLGRRVAIKFATATHDKQQFRARFLREARAISALSHPNIATLHDYGETPDGRQYIVMELVKGKNLSELLSAGSLTIERVVRIVADVAEALGDAHGHGIVHRDIKPSNLMLTDQGRVKVLDFGLAKQMVGECPPSDPNAQTITGVHTRSDVVVGTLLYLSPEQATGVPVDGRSDLFALGAVLYECVAGRPPFSGANAIEICAQVIHINPPPPSELNSLVPPVLDHIVLKALAKKPEERYQSANEMVADLRAVQSLLQEAEEMPTKRMTLSSSILHKSAHTTFSSQLRRPRFSAIFFLALLLGALGIWFGLRWWRAAPYTPPPEAARLYQIGEAALRDGTYYKASKVLENAIAVDGSFALAHARLAEAWMELDYMEKAKDEILIAKTLASDPSQLPPLQAIYLQAITNIVMRNFAGAAENYREIVRQSVEAEKAAAYVDLGRAYEKNEEVDNAIESYLEATNRDPRSAAAFLRLGILYGRKQNQESAMTVFEKAEKLYRALDYYEGVTEVLYQRGLYFSQLGKAAEARSQLQQALDITQITANQSQRIKSLLQLSGVAYIEGRTEQAKQYATEAIELAQKNDVENLTTQGLIDLGNAFFARREYDEAEKYFKQALDIAMRNKGRRNEAMARLSLGRLYIQQEVKTDEGLQHLEQALAFFQQGGYKKEVSQALLLRGRAELQKGDFAGALREFDEQLRLAQQVNDPAQLANSHLLIGSLLADQEIYPEALRHFEESYSINRRLGIPLNIGYSLLNRSNMLWRLGNYQGARAALDEVPEIVNRLDGNYQQVLRARTLLVESQMALSERRLPEAKSKAEQALALAGTQIKHAAVEAKCTLGLTQTLMGATREGKKTCEEAVEMATREDNPRLLSQATLSLAEATLASGDAQAALAIALRAQELLARAGQQESEWRAWLVAARAGYNIDSTAARQYLDSADNLMTVLQQKWGAEAFNGYLTRPDIQLYRKQLSEASALTRNN
jgi:serine/threonine protein kinase/Tfp pilus assembly protein PilF